MKIIFIFFLLASGVMAGDQYMYMVIPETLTPIEKSTATSWQKTSFKDASGEVKLAELPQWSKAGVTNRILCIDIGRKDNAEYYKKINTATISKVTILTGNDVVKDLVKAGFKKVIDDSKTEIEATK